MAKVWQWHKSKVERFIAKLKSEALIETEIRSNRLIVTICNIDKYSSVSSEFATETETELRQDNSDNDLPRQNRDNIETDISLNNTAVSNDDENYSRQNQDHSSKKEENKKRTKKTKEENKEKNPPL